MRYEHRQRGRGHGEPSFGPGRGGRMRRGDTRIALLGALADGPAHGYELIQRLEERTRGMWRPSPGSVYPTLQMLEEQGLIRGEQRDDKRVYAITEAGTAELQERLSRAGGPPWANADLGGHGPLRHAIGQLALAAKQVGMQGDPALVERATAVLNDARKQLYAMLADA